MPLQDVTVTIDIIKPAEYVGFGKPLILAEKTGPLANLIKDYKSLTEVQADFAADTPAYAKAKAVLDQEHRPATLSIAFFDPAGTGATNPAALLEQVYDYDWVFAVAAGADVAESIAVADLVETKRYKFFVTVAGTEEDRATFKAKEYERTIVIYHTEADEHPDAALVGEVGNMTVGSVTWKFKTLTGITPLDVQADELQEIHDDGAIAYVTKAGKNQTSEGFVVSGEYIDVMHGKDWIKFNMEMSVQQALQDSPKVPYTDNGISLFEGAATTVLQTAVAQGIIDRDDAGNPRYTITAKTRSEMSDEDRQGRKYGGLFFSYTPEGAIHEGEIKGEIYK